jgi:uncharacterized protein (UPF0332 family)
VIDEKRDFLLKAREALASAESDFANGRYNSAASRAYYACFHAAIAVLIDASVRPPAETWGHSYVQAQFSGGLIRQSKLFPSNLRDVLQENLRVRLQADYDPSPVTEKEAKRAVERAKLFVESVGTKVRS